MAYKSTTDHAKEIRAAYKARGWSSRKVSVRSEYFSMGSSIHVTVKHPEVCAVEAERIAKEHSAVRRCEMTGDILSGGNRYVSTSYSSECEAALAAPYLEALTEAVAGLEAEGLPRGTHREIEGPFEASVTLESPGYARLWVNGRREIEFSTHTPAALANGAHLLAVVLRRKKVETAAAEAAEAELAELGSLEELVAPA